MSGISEIAETTGFRVVSLIFKFYKRILKLSEIENLRVLLYGVVVYQQKHDLIGYFCIRFYVALDRLKIFMEGARLKFLFMK